MKKSDRALTDGRDVQLFDSQLGFVARFLDLRGHVPRPCAVVRSLTRCRRTSVDLSLNVGLHLHAGDHQRTMMPIAHTLTADRHDRTYTFLGPAPLYRPGTTTIVVVVELALTVIRSPM